MTHQTSLPCKHQCNQCPATPYECFWWGLGFITPKEEERQWREDMRQHVKIMIDETPREFKANAYRRQIKELKKKIIAGESLSRAFVAGDKNAQIEMMLLVLDNLNGLDNIPEQSNNDFWLCAGLHTMRKELEKLRRRVRSFEMKLSSLYRRKAPQSVDLEAIRAIPITDIMPSKPDMLSPNRIFYKCPWRNEKHASLVVYLDQNRWHDFGANEGGSIIDMYIKLNDCDVKTAIRELNKMI
jgi:hypothetical protein